MVIPSLHTERTSKMETHQTHHHRDETGRTLHRLLEHGGLRLFFAPICVRNDRNKENSYTLFGHEVSMRGPTPCALRTPQSLLVMAREYGMLDTIFREGSRAAVRRFLKTWAKQAQLRLFLYLEIGRVAPGMMDLVSLLDPMLEAGLSGDRLVIHLSAGTGSCGVAGYLEEVVVGLRQLAHGVALGLDELGMTYEEALLLWQRHRPEYIILSPYTTCHLAGEGDDHQTASAFVRRAVVLAHSGNGMVLAQGADNVMLLSAMAKLGVNLFQGSAVGVAADHPPLSIMMTSARPSADGSNDGMTSFQDTIADILQETPPITPSTRMNEVGEVFRQHPEVRSLAVVDPETEKPVGIIRRNQFLEIMGTQYGRDLYGKKKVSHFLDPHPNVFELSATLEEVGQVLTASQDLEVDFIMTEQGRYAGIGRAHSLLEKIINLRVNKARYMNPLSGLPGNVPVQETLRQLLAAKRPIAVCYIDLDNFKAFNDVYGYSSGDQAILLLARVLRASADPTLDFIGHIGGDDFIAFYQSKDWQRRIRVVMDQFVAEARNLYSEEDRQRGYIEATDRQGNPACFPLLSLSVAVVLPDPAVNWTVDDIARLAAEAKHDAKAIPGASLVIHPSRKPYPERRQERSSLPLKTDEAPVAAHSPAQAERITELGAS